MQCSSQHAVLVSTCTFKTALIVHKLEIRFFAREGGGGLGLSEHGMLWCATQETAGEGSGEEGWAGSDADYAGDGSEYEEEEGPGLQRYYGMSFEELQTDDSELEADSEEEYSSTWVDNTDALEEARGPPSTLNPKTLNPSFSGFACDVQW